MRTTAVLLLIAATLPAQNAAHAIDSTGRFNADLSGKGEMPGPGDPDGEGSAQLIVADGNAQICYSLTASGIAAATMAHIHRGAEGTAGPPVVTLEAPSTGKSSGCADAPAEIRAEIANSPGAFYVNIHNAEFPRGAIRGQLSN